MKLSKPTCETCGSRCSGRHWHGYAQVSRGSCRVIGMTRLVQISKTNDREWWSQFDRKNEVPDSDCMASRRGTKSSSCFSFPIHLFIHIKINLNSLCSSDTVMIWDENQTRSMAVNRISARRRYPEKANMPYSATVFTMPDTAKEMTKKWPPQERTEGV